MAPKIKFYTGAPFAGDLDWTEHNLLNELLPSFDGEKYPNGQTSQSHVSQANWRCVSLDATGEGLTDQDQGHFDTRAITSTADQNELFIEHSLTILDALQSSQLAPYQEDESTVEAESTFLTNESLSASFDTSILSPGVTASSTPLTSHSIRPIRASITPLSSIPPARHLIRARPQTITVNLIVGVISIASPRTVHVKRGDYDIEILEMSVGDETKAGFSVSIWMSPQPRNHIIQPQTSLRATVESLRPGHVIYIGRLALADFNGQVFGQSLNRKSSGVFTNFVQLEAAAMSRSVLHDPEVVAKTERVSAWVDQFVGTRNVNARKRKTEEIRNDHRSLKSAKVALQNREWLPDDSPG